MESGVPLKVTNRILEGKFGVPIHFFRMLKLSAADGQLRKIRSARVKKGFRGWPSSDHGTFMFV
jgi:hypothetical protein